MRNILMYLVYGDEPRYWKELRYSIISAYQHLGSDADSIQFVVCSDKVDPLPGFPVIYHTFDSTQLKQWAEPDQYFHRCKNRAMAEVMDRFEAPVVFIDTDTVFRQSPALLFQRMSSLQVVMHCSEGPVFVNHLKLAAYLRDYRLPDPRGGWFDFSSESTMWNSGVVGLLPEHRPLLDRALWLVDELYGYTGIFNIEQFGLGEVLRREVKIAESSDVVDHYWGFPWRFYSAWINHFLEQYGEAPFSEQVSASRNLKMGVPAHPLLDRIWYRIKRDLYSQRPLFSWACLALRASRHPGKMKYGRDNLVRPVWREIALEWLQQELSSLEESAKKNMGVEQQLACWWRERELAQVREESSLSMLPSDEQVSWRSLWHDAAKLKNKLSISPRISI